MWGVDRQVAPGLVLLPGILLHDGAYGGALRVPEDEAGAYVVGDRVQVQVAAQAAVVAAARLLHPLEVGVQLVLGLPRAGVDALEHGVALVAAPVSARHRHQLEDRDLPGGLHVAAAA